MAGLAFFPQAEKIRRKPPASEQFNWISGKYDVVPEQLELDIPLPDDAVLPDDNTVTLLATENGAQLLVAGFGLYIGKKGERIVVKKGGKVCAQIPFMRAQEVIIASRGVSFSSDLLEELCARGIRVGCMTSSGRPGGTDHVATANGDGRDSASPVGRHG